MAVKKTGISRELVIHPGETIADILEERGISQAELAIRTGVSAAYMSSVIAGRKGISANFAMNLEYALGVAKSFWLNLQANYEAELLEVNEELTITGEEKEAREAISEIVKYLREKGMIPMDENTDTSILSLRKFLQISNLANLKEMIPSGAFRIDMDSNINPYVLGAWIRLCQILGERQVITVRFDKKYVNCLADEMKQIMCRKDADIQNELKEVLSRYGIDFSLARNFDGAPVQGYISRKNEGIYRVVLTIRGEFADIFWFSLFHEIGHIVNGDVGKIQRFVDDGSDDEKEKAADLFANNILLEEESYHRFIQDEDFSVAAIKKYAESQRVMPYIVTGRLQKEKYIDDTMYCEHVLRYKWKD